MATARLLAAAVTHRGEKLVRLFDASPVLMVFLRHAGCMFCREALADIAKCLAGIEGNGVRVVLVHMGDGADIEGLLKRYGLEGLDRIADPEQNLYRTFGLKRGRPGQLFGLHVWIRAIFDGVLRRHGLGKARADSKQMPGLFLIDRGEIVRWFRHRDVADQPDYVMLTAMGAE